MTENEAIEIIEEYKGLFPNARNESESLDIAIKAIEWQKAFKKTYKGFPKDVDVACDIAIKALEKQIPKKPNLEGDGYADGQIVYDTWICPCCENHYEVYCDDYDFCPNCGQAIDWSDTD